MLSAESDAAAERLVRFLTDNSMRIAAAESCTSGLLASFVGRIPGASRCFWGSYVCYTSQAKMYMLGVKEELLSEYGTVSGETAKAMALGALEKSGVDLAVSITGVAGPGSGGSPCGLDIPIGTVWIATALRSSEDAQAEKFYFSGGRNSVRAQATVKALEQIMICLTKITH